jgi:hypothetical protein
LTENQGGRSAWDDDDDGPFDGPPQGAAGAAGPSQGTSAGAGAAFGGAGAAFGGAGGGSAGPGTGTYGTGTHGSGNQGTGTSSAGTATYGGDRSGYQRPGPPDDGHGTGGRKLSRNAVLGIVIGALVLVGGGTGVGVALAGKSTTTTTTPPTPTTNSPGTASPRTTSSPNTTPSSNSNGSTLIVAPGSLEPNAPFNNCTDLTPSERGVPDSTDEVICVGSDVANDGAAQAFYATFSSPTAAAAYLATLAPSISAPGGPCNDVTLGFGTALCTFSDNTPESGTAVMYIGTNFTFGPGATAEANCGAENQPSSAGTAVLVFHYTGSNVVGGAYACEANVTPLTTIRSSLYNADFELDNQ